MMQVLTLENLLSARVDAINAVASFMREVRGFGEGAILDRILVETRVFGELIPLIVCSTALILEELLAARIHASVNTVGTGMPAPTLQPQVVGAGSEQHDRAA